MKLSKVTKEEVVENADVMYAVMEFTNEYQKQKGGKEQLPDLPKMKPKEPNSTPSVPPTPNSPPSTPPNVASRQDNV